ncbi:MAG: ABC transporter ATP-binding protein [Desulfurococcales archaeon ex4484_217_2]|nr:MAG: ABC transporter ATP-binding protein [Desulfurococcales archaeon ex4484_217_2]
MRKTILKLINVKKIYRTDSIETYALRGVNLEVYEGDFIAIMGPSGSGKTTLLNILGLLDKPTSGKVLIDGVDVSKLSDTEMAKIRNYKIGFVFQQFNLVSRLTVLENIELPLLVRGIPRSKRIEMVKEALLKVGGDLSWLNKKPTQLSGGQQQRVAIARAIVGKPEVVLADEPTGNLDSASAKVIMKTFIELNRLGHTIVMVTHDPEVAACAEKTLLLRDGRIVGETVIDKRKCKIYVA